MQQATELPQGAIPPLWTLNAHPEILKVLANGIIAELERACAAGNGVATGGHSTTVDLERTPRDTESISKRHHSRTRESLCSRQRRLLIGNVGNNGEHVAHTLLLVGRHPFISVQCFCVQSEIEWPFQESSPHSSSQRSFRSHLHALKVQC